MQIYDKFELTANDTLKGLEEDRKNRNLEITNLRKKFFCKEIEDFLSKLGIDSISSDRDTGTAEDYNKYFENSNVKKDFDFTFYDKDNNPIVKTIFKTSLEFPPCVRTYMAMQEHLRWNAYTISMGVIPSTVKEIIETRSNGKDYLICRKHGNITTFDGLLKFDKIVAIKNYIKDQISNKWKEENKNIENYQVDKEMLEYTCQNIFINDFDKVK